MIQIAAFEDTHLAAALALSQAVGWPHRLGDWKMLQNLSQGAVALDGSKVIGTAFRADFGPELSTLCMIIVAPDMQGQGIGRKLMTALMGNHRSYRLIATHAGRPLYEKLGFTETGQIVQCQGRLVKIPEDIEIGPASNEDLASIAELERSSYGADRSALLRWLKQNADLAVSRSSGQVWGFAALRAFGKGHVIGPIVAPTPQVAQSLVTYLARDLVGTFLRLDVSEESELAPWLEDIGLATVAKAPIMQRQGPLHSPTRMAVFSQALG
ncbi:MAG: GNAT family N-acetyltransferase [Pseudomonadota bacterium]